MKMRKLCLSVFFAAIAAFSNTAAAQNQAPHIGYVYPAGGQTGTTVTTIVGGMNMKDMDSAFISGKGVSVKSASAIKLFNDKFSNDLKNEIRPMLEAMEKGQDPIAALKKSTEDMIARLKKQHEKEIAENAADPAKKDAKTDSGDIYENILKVVPGEKLIYIDKTPEELVEMIRRLSPMEYQCLCKSVFAKTDALQTSPAIEQNAIVEIEIAKDAIPGMRELRLRSTGGYSNPIFFEVGKLPENSDPFFSSGDQNPVRKIETFPSLLNGQIMPGEVDRFKFMAKAGGEYAFSVLGRGLLPFIGDAVPGWFQPVLSIHDDNGKLLAYSDSNMFDPDPVLGFTAPANGIYEVRIRDSLYRGREDFVYRLKAETGPPPQIEMKELKLDYEIAKIKESENNDSSSDAQRVDFPVLISGAIDKPGDVDFFRIKATKGQKVAVEVFARRLDSQMDSLLQILDDDGKILASNDDWDCLYTGMKTHHSDSYCLFDVPEDGKYFIRVSDTQAKGGEKFKYFLRIDNPHPDFQVYMDPSALNVTSANSNPFTVHVQRKDGFDLPINIAVEDGPEGARIDGNVILPGVDTMSMTLFLNEKTGLGLHKFSLCAEARSDGLRVVRKVIPSDNVMQAFIYMHLVPSEDFMLFVKRRTWLPKIKLPDEIAIRAGEEKTLSFQCPGFKPNKDNDYFLELYQPPNGISVADGEFQGENYVFQIKAAPETKPCRTNLIFLYLSEKKKDNPKRSRWPAGFLPAIPVKIAEKLK